MSSGTQRDAMQPTCGSARGSACRWWSIHRGQWSRARTDEAAEHDSQKMGFCWPAGWLPTCQIKPEGETDGDPTAKHRVPPSQFTRTQTPRCNPFAERRPYLISPPAGSFLG
ncbi:uncharacterized protein CIMG_13368 [Coccidioides immitis RS]|uniref:Uncharacterized protein n=1 Tax=Coccidioides immitis (strain RS) TaxID=246410 RepID=A0A0D8JVM3_COCIM|nr:uncharacterized protein CIMG_13368 [Coccidioides immitis RS]KJF60991.1 hypothetical protein CIMG_13368 [Coccidioides immitis RS]